MAIPDLTSKANPPPIGPTLIAQSPPIAATETASSEPSENFSHLDDALAAVGEAPGGDAVAIETPAPSPHMPRDAWCKFYLGSHDVAGHMLGSKVLSTVSARPMASDAAGAMYDTILEVPALHFLISPDSQWLQRTMILGQFYFPLIRELKAEKRAKPSDRAADQDGPIAPTVLPPEAL